MRLELGTFPVRAASFGPRTRYVDGRLEIDRDEVLSLLRSDPHVTYADAALARPGESVRIVNLSDVVEPRVKVGGPGVVYPGVCGRSVETVGRGRTHRLGGFAVVECAGTAGGEPSSRGEIARRQDFVDMAGPGAVRPYAQSINLVLALGTDPELNEEDRHLAAHGATLRVADRLAAAIARLDPPELELFDLTTRDQALPGIVFIPILASSEFRAGPDSKVGPAVYGLTRLSAPWVLHPTELMDGAVSQGTSWPLLNNPVVMSLARRHGRELSFLAVIVHRSNWGGQAEMELAAYRDAQAAVLLGARGAIVSTNIRGRRFVDVVACVKACEAEGIKTVLVTEEEDSEGGSATPLLINDPSIVAAVSTGTGGVPGGFQAVERVVGAASIDASWYDALPPLAGRYGAHHIQDHYGSGRQSCADF